MHLHDAFGNYAAIAAPVGVVGADVPVSPSLSLGLAVERSFITVLLSGDVGTFLRGPKDHRPRAFPARGSRAGNCSGHHVASHLDCAALLRALRDLSRRTGRGLRGLQPGVVGARGRPGPALRGARGAGAARGAAPPGAAARRGHRPLQQPPRRTRICSARRPGP